MLNETSRLEQQESSRMSRLRSFHSPFQVQVELIYRHSCTDRGYAVVVAPHFQERSHFPSLSSSVAKSGGNVDTSAFACTHVDTSASDSDLLTSLLRHLEPRRDPLHVGLRPAAVPGGQRQRDPDHDHGL